MNWFYTAIVLLIVCITFGILEHKDGGYGSWKLIVSIASGVICFFILLLNSILYFVAIPNDINKLNQQKAYIENHISENVIEDAALTNKKIELNEWLYEAQFSKERFKGWSIYPDKIKDLTPIK